MNSDIQQILSLMEIDAWRLKESVFKTENTVAICEQENESLVDDVPSEEHEAGEPIEQYETQEEQSTLDIWKMDWESLQKHSDDGALCASCAKNNTLFGIGDKNAPWVCVVDAPSIQGLAEGTFVSTRQHQLLVAILRAIGLEQKDVFLTSVFKCPPAQDMHDNQVQCGAILHRQLELLNAKKAIGFGEFVGQNVLHSHHNLAYFQAQETLPVLHDTKVLVTHSLAEMLHAPQLKASVWQGLKQILIEG